MPEPRIQALCDHLATISRLNQAAALLSWDQETYMPAKAAATRAEQLATLSQYAHEILVSDATANLLERAREAAAQLDPDSDEARMVSVAQREYDQSAKLPSRLVGELSRATALGHASWVQARQRQDFKLFAPHLQTILDLTRELADCLGYAEHPYDALLDMYEPGMTSRQVTDLFNELRPALVNLASRISKQPHADDRALRRNFPVDKQRQLTLAAIQAIGFDLERGRQDETVHPFCTNFGRDDVRLTTRFDANFLPMALYGSLHEMGHGLYEQGSPETYENTPLAGGASLGVHESQSRLWENLVGRSLPFTKWLYPRLQELFPESLGNTTVEEYYRAINRVHPSCIRVEADEVTYNLHILLRYELELTLLDGTLAVQDLPEAWNAKMQEYLGITPADDAQGVLQDTHWSIGSIGYFPTYTLGNILSGQLWQSIQNDLPDLDVQLEAGEFAALLGWLRERVHRYGRKYLPAELVVKATGRPLSTKPYLEYLETKFSGLYGL